MATMLERKEAATGHRGRSSISLIEQKRLLEEATRKAAGLATRAYAKALETEMKKLVELKTNC